MTHYSDLKIADPAIALDMLPPALRLMLNSLQPHPPTMHRGFLTWRSGDTHVILRDFDDTFASIFRLDLYDLGAGPQRPDMSATTIPAAIRLFDEYRVWLI